MTMAEISLNNEKYPLTANTTISQLLQQYGFVEDKIAVAINSEFVPRSSYTTRILQAGDEVDVLSAVQGG